jgi:hypothetical protein
MWTLPFIGVCGVLLVKDETQHCAVEKNHGICAWESVL